MGKNTSKVSNKAKMNININSSQNTKKTRRAVKKMTFKTICVSLLLFVIATIIGVGVAFFLTKNDCFVINGSDEITLMLNEHYVDQGAKVVAFGVDDSNKVKVTTNLKYDDNGYYAEEEGTYYIIYTVENLKYGSIFKVQKIRLITFVEPTESSEVQNV